MRAGFLLLLLNGACGNGRPVPPADDEPDPCDADPTASGCPCTEGDALPCYDGPAETRGVGTCVEGSRSCEAGVWGTCNAADDDCDGTVDDGVLLACGDCDPGCSIVGYGPADDLAFDDPSTDADGAVVDGAGRLGPGGSLAPRDVLWSPADSYTVARVDTAAREVVGEYLVDWAASNRRAAVVAVDYAGNAYFANEGTPSQTSLTKVLYECVDADRDGTIETSDGPGNVLEFEDDECVPWRGYVSCADLRSCDMTTAAAYEMRVDDGALAERVWVGLYEGGLHEVDAETGEETGVVAVCPDRCAPYGAVVDRDGYLWTDCGPELCRFPTRDPDATETFARPELTSQDITLDPDGHVWTAGYAATFDPDVEEWTIFNDYFGHGVTSDADGNVYVGACPSGDVSGSFCRFDGVTFDVTVIPGDLRILAVDSRGLVWGFHGGTFVYDPSTGAVDPALDCGGDPCVYGPWNGCDMTGTQLVQSTDAPGTWRAHVPPCAEGQATTWLALEWEADLPDGAAVRFEARAANDDAALSAHAWTEVANAPEDASPADLQAALSVDRTAPMLELRATLAKDPGAAGPATLGAVRVRRRCE